LTSVTTAMPLWSTPVALRCGSGDLANAETHEQEEEGDGEEAAHE